MTISDNKIRGVAYIGDDLQDLPGMEVSDIIGCPSDATQGVKDIADYVSEYRGGCGAVRDFVEWILREVN